MFLRADASDANVASAQDVDVGALRGVAAVSLVVVGYDPVVCKFHVFTFFDKRAIFHTFY